MARGELYNDDPRLKDARLCGTTASLCGLEGADSEEEREKALALDITLHAFLLTQSGIPVLYSGDEIAQLNDLSYHEDPLKKEDSRYLHRGAFSWKDAEKRKDPETPEGRIFQALRKLEELRFQTPVFDSDADVWTLEPYNDCVLGIGRYYERQKMIALFNFSPDPQIAWINEKEPFYDMLTGQERPARGVELPGYGFCWLLTDFGDPTTL